MLIHIEGIDGAGKTTTIEKLKKKLLNKVVYGVDPGTTMLGEHIRDVLVSDITLSESSRLLLHLSARSVMNDHLPSGTKIIDRGLLSTLAYNCQILTQEEILQLNFLLDIRIPDLIIFIDTLPKIALERVQARGETDSLERLTSIRDSYFSAMDLLRKYCKIEIVPGNKNTVDVVQSIIEKRL